MIHKIGYTEDMEPVNLLEQYRGRLWEHEQGKLLLKALFDLGLALHNIENKTKQTIQVFQEILESDPEDHLVSHLVMSISSHQYQCQYHLALISPISFVVRNLT
jgi:hypothetical protein